MAQRIMNEAICREAAKRCNSRTEFHHKDNLAWKYAKKTGLIETLFPIKLARQSSVTFVKCQNLINKLKQSGQTTPFDFWKANRNMFEIARDNWWLSSFYPSYKIRRHLTIEDIRALASSCSTRTEFARLDGAAYKKACDMHIIAELFPNTIHHAAWNKESCKLAALSCSSRREFETKYNSAWKVALHNGWLDEWLPKEHREVTEERCREIAMHCHSRSEFRAKSDHLYNYALSHKLIDIFANDYNWLPTSVVESNAQRKYSDNEVEEEAKKYRKLSTFRRKNKRMYEIAQERNLLSRFTWLQRNEEVIANGFHDAVYVYEFLETKTAYIGRTINKKARDRAHHTNSKVKQYADSIGVPVPNVKYIADNITPEQGQSLEAETIIKYANNGWSLLNQQSHSGLGVLTKISKKAYIDFAKQFEFWNDLYKASQSKFNILRKYGWDTECTWLKNKKAKNGTWSNASFEQIQQEAIKYRTRTEFMRGSKAAYERARSQNGWVDKLFPVSYQKGNAKPIAAYNPISGEVVKEWPSTKIAAMELNAYPSTITEVLKGKRKTHRGLVFKYV